MGWNRGPASTPACTAIHRGHFEPPLQVAIFTHKKGQAPKGLPFKNQLSNRLDSDDILCLWAFFALRNHKLDFLAFNQSFEAITNDSTEVGKNIWA